MRVWTIYVCCLGISLCSFQFSYNCLSFFHPFMFSYCILLSLFPASLVLACLLLDIYWLGVMLSPFPLSCIIYTIFAICSIFSDSNSIVTNLSFSSLFLFIASVVSIFSPSCTILFSCPFLLSVLYLLHVPVMGSKVVIKEITMFFLSFCSMLCETLIVFLPTVVLFVLSCPQFLLVLDFSWPSSYFYQLLCCLFVYICLFYWMGILIQSSVLLNSPYVIFPFIHF